MEPTDWITAAAAVASAVVAFLLWRVTRRYTNETGAIAEANKTMATANNRMADANDQLVEMTKLLVDANNGMMTASVAALKEMAADRELARRQRSEESAYRLQLALSRAQRQWQTGNVWEDPEATAAIHNDWVEAISNDRDALLSNALRDDITRFTGILQVAVTDWDTLLLTVEQHLGEQDAAQRRSGDNRSFRLNWAATELRRALGVHRRGEDRAEAGLPEDSWEYWLTSPRDWRDNYQLRGL